jgi:hypothetical protein
MPVPTMAMPMESMQGAAKTAIGRGATFHQPSIRAARSIRNASRTAVYPRHKTHRYGADGRGTHHGQDDTARTFHGITRSCSCERLRKPSPDIQALALRQSCDLQASQSQLSHRIVRDAAGRSRRQPPPEKCDVNACANPPNPPRVTPPEPESDEVPAEEWPDEVSPLKKPLRDAPPEAPWPPLDEDPRGGHSALVCGPDGVAIPGRLCSQFSPGINA